MTSFGIEILTEDTKENVRSPSIALLRADLLRIGMVRGLERGLRVCDGFFCRVSVTYDGAVLLSFFLSFSFRLIPKSL